MNTSFSSYTTPAPSSGHRHSAWVLAGIATIAVALALLVGGCGEKTAKVPNTVNQSLTVAQQLLSDQGFEAEVKRVTSKRLNNEVLSQDPVGGTEEKTGEEVTLTVSNGPGEGIVPHVAGAAADRAEQELIAASFKPVVVEVFSSVHEAGYAVSTNPAAGTEVQKDTKITLNVSKGPQQVTVPNVIGLSENNANSTLAKFGFRVHHAFQTANKTPGSVLSQNPVGETRAGLGSSVQIVIDRAPKKVSVPNTVGMTQSQGDKTLANAKLNAVYAIRIVTSAAQNGIVLAENPRSGSTVVEGTNVALTIGKYNRPVPPVPPVPPPGPSSIVKQFNLASDSNRTYTIHWASGSCTGGQGNAVLKGDGGGSAMSGAQITAQGAAGSGAYYATIQTSDLTSPVTLVITITCAVQ